MVEIPEGSLPVESLVPGQSYRITGFHRSSAASDKKNLIGVKVMFLSAGKYNEDDETQQIDLTLQEDRGAYFAGSDKGWYCYLGPLEPLTEVIDPLEMAWFDYVDQLNGDGGWDGAWSGFNKFQAGWQAAKEHFTKEKPRCDGSLF